MNSFSLSVAIYWLEGSGGTREKHPHWRMTNRLKEPKAEVRNHFLNCNFSLTSFAKDLPDTDGTETREGEETVCCFPYTFGDNGPCWSVIYFLYRKLRGRESIQWKRKKENPKHIFLITGIKCRLPERPPDNMLPLHLINELGNCRTLACKIHHKRAHFFENWKDPILKQKITWCSGARRGPPKMQLLVFAAFSLLDLCAPCHPLSLAPLSYSTHFLLEFVSFWKGWGWGLRRGRNGTQMLLLSSAILGGIWGCLWPFFHLNCFSMQMFVLYLILVSSLQCPFTEQDQK